MAALVLGMRIHLPLLRNGVRTLAEKGKFVLSINTSAALLGMGYIVGLKYAAIICFGSIAVWWLIVPGIAFIFPDLAVVEASADTNAVLAANASPEQLFNYAKSIGIGGIAMAGIIGVIKSWGVIKSAFGLVGKIFKGGAVDEKVARTQRDLSMKIIAIGSLLTLIVTTLFFYFDVMGGSLLFTVVGILIVAVISFLFTTLQPMRLPL
ncbi:oligopeptide transporter, OPT family [gut metagenome]|uniref:Oligopeptide transporter, OPT family n=1 Tax=gut metagenome TaxID=749906 RepID=J9BS64_9ZZZZ